MTGALAWAALRARYPSSAHALQVDRERAAGGAAVDISFSRSSAALRALRWRGRADVGLCWHADLLPLLRLAKPDSGILFLHGIESWRRPAALQRWALRSVTTVLANSQHTLERARAHGFLPASLPASVVPLGIGEPAASVDRPLPTPVALMVSRLDHGERYKGHEEVIRAWADVRERVPAAELWIAGAGDLRAELERLAQRSRHAASIRFFGRVPESEKQRLLSHARCMVLPSRAEGFGLVYLEAMRLGRPCLVSGTDAGREVVNPPECGLAADPADAPALTAALVRLLSDSAEWQQWSVHARARYQALFTARAFQDRLLAAIEAA